jgi:UDP-N-acetyl-D-mannosaminuronic acid dehydrogenase
MKARFEHEVAIVGGCGHVGLPLGLAFASQGVSTLLYDINGDAVDLVNQGTMPFLEYGAQPILDSALGAGLISATKKPDAIALVENVVVVIGTPVSKHLTPDLTAVTTAVDDVFPYLQQNQLMILRSTVFPGVTQGVCDNLASQGLELDLAYCPERIAEGRALTELFELPQIVAGFSERATKRAADLFRKLTPRIVYLEPMEAEVAKLITNFWRYIQFAAANQLYMLANDFKLDYEKIRAAIVQDYPRASGLPRAGFSAGPCLLNDTMQLAAFNNNHFTLGQSAMNINEGLPLYVVSRLAQDHDLSQMTVGILGMAFKAETDDTRSSLSYKLKKILEFHSKEVLCTDPYVVDDRLVPLDEVMERADLLVVGAPHREYADLEPGQPVADVWGILGRGVQV